ncbi:hypothetical protein [Candidatus Binatus sp.]|uniref:hypothetical protein n=1 Tax=Candidatus Binatus sp. TaxID=2811406 RepID=UPI003BB0BC6E
MRIEAKLKKYPGPEECGSIVWNSETGELAGTLAAEIGEAAHEADARGWVPVGPQMSCELKVKDPPEWQFVILSFRRIRLLAFGSAPHSGAHTGLMQVPLSQANAWDWIQNAKDGIICPKGLSTCYKSTYLIDLDTERARYLLGNLSAAEAWVASFHLEDRVDEFP